MLKIKDFEDYTIDKKGNVFSIRKHKYLKHSINKYACATNLCTLNIFLCLFFCSVTLQYPYLLI